MSEQFTKQRIFDAAEELMLRKSFESVSLNEILKATGTPKGGFYHHFESKESFGTELIKHYTDETVSHHSELLLNREMEPNARLRILTHYEAGIAKFIENGGNCPCLLIKLASETSFGSPAMRKQISQGYDRIGRLYEQVIQEGQDAGDISTERSAKSTADLMTTLWLGAVKQALAHQKAEILRTSLEFIAQVIIPTGKTTPLKNKPQVDQVV